MFHKTETYQLVVVGGGLAGFCAAVAAARQGIQTCLIHNRPVLGGNSSSEVRVTPHGSAAFHAYARETGILSELLIEERALNHEEIFENGWTNSVWDLTLYNMVMNTPNLTLHVNTDVQEVIVEERKIVAVKAIILNAEVQLTVMARTFIDCTGDGTVAFRAGCEWRMGTESRVEFGEPHAPEEASSAVMGNSIHFKTKDMGRPVPFQAPDWAIRYEDASFFYQQGREPKQEKGGFWWLEIGIPYHTIEQNETIRHELTRHALGVWHWMKNQDPVMMERTKNYALDWIGQVPGKRESRRIMGHYLMTEHDAQKRTVFPDEIAFGGWFVDLHTPGGLLAKSSEPSNAEGYNTFTEYAVQSYVGPYGIPLRSLIAKDVDNLLMAGRNISVTHAALGTVRVMGTTALMGQAAGTAAAVALQQNIPLAAVPTKAITTVQQQLLRDGCFLPNYRNADPKDLARSAKVSASSQAVLYGAGPDSRGAHEGLNFWKDQPQYLKETLENRRAQLIALATTHLERIEVCLNNTSDRPQVVQAQLRVAEHIWDYRPCELETLAETELTVPVGQHWVSWPVALTSLSPGGYLRLDLLPNPHVQWRIAGKLVPGHVAMYQISPTKMRRFGNGHTLSYRVKPGQPCFGPENVLSGVTRPYECTNLWQSDPTQPLTQWLQLSWEQARRLSRVELTFPGHLIREYHAYGPFYRDPQCPKDYSVTALIDGNWETLLSVSGNYQRQRIHPLNQPVTTEAIRINIHATNGDPSAQLYEVRCY